MRLTKRAALGATGASILALSSPAFSQSAPEGALRPDANVPALPPPAYATPPAPAPELAPPMQVAPSTATSRPITLTEVDVEGDVAEASVKPWPRSADPATGLVIDLRSGELLGPQWVRRLFADNQLIGKPVAYSRVVEFIQLMNARFAAHGYVNSGLLVPQQEPIENRGPLRLRLVLGRIAPEALSIADPAKGLSKDFVRERLGQISRQPFNAAQFEREFRLLAENPAVATVNADLRPTGKAGEAALTVSVIPVSRADLYVTYANSRTPSIGSNRSALGGSFRNAVIAGDQVAAEVGRTKGITDVSGNYGLPLLGPRTRAFVSGGYNDAAVIEASLEPLDIKTKSLSLGGGVEHALIARPLLPAGQGRFRAAHTLTAKLQIDYRDTRTYLLGERFSFSPGSVDGRARYSAARLGLDFVSRSVSEVLAAAVTLSVGIDGTGSDVPGVAAPKKHWIGLLGQATFARRLTKKGLELRTRITGQYHNSVAYSGERLPIGGLNSVRGYRETLYLVDRAVIGSVELSHPVRLGGGEARRAFDPGAFTVSAFVDGAWFDNVDVPDPGVDSIAGAGLGLQWLPNPGLNARLTWAENFRRVRIGGDKDLQDRGIYFGISVRPLEWIRKSHALP